MKSIVNLILMSGLVMMIATSCNNTGGKGTGSEETVATSGKAVSGDSKDVKPEHLTAAKFKEKIWNYEKNPEKWTYEGTLPCVVDFYADWCKPCKIVAPIMDDLADYYEGRVKIYKVDTDDERELASVFQVRSIPSILFAPINGQPAMQPGALSKEQYIQIIDEFVLGIKNDTVNQKNNL